MENLVSENGVNCITIEVWTTSERCVYVPVAISDGADAVIEKITNTLMVDGSTLTLRAIDGKVFVFPVKNISYLLFK